MPIAKSQAGLGVLGRVLIRNSKKTLQNIWIQTTLKWLVMLVTYLFLFCSITQNILNQKQIEGNGQFMNEIILFWSNLMICLKIQSVTKSYSECVLQTAFIWQHAHWFTKEKN